MRGEHSVAADMRVSAVLVTRGSSGELGSGGLTFRGRFVLVGKLVESCLFVGFEKVEEPDLLGLPTGGVVDIQSSTLPMEGEVIHQDGTEGVAFEQVVQMVLVVHDGPA